MKVIFLKNLPGTAKVGDVKSVSDGYARNYLLPKGLAKPATSQALAELSSIKKAKKKETQSLRDRSTVLAAKIKGKTIEIEARATEAGDKLYAAITPDEVKSALREKGIDIGEAQVVFDRPVKETGTHQAKIDFGGNIFENIKLKISAE